MEERYPNVQELVILVTQLAVQRNEALTGEEEAVRKKFYDTHTLSNEDAAVLQGAMSRMMPQRVFKFVPQIKGGHVRTTVFVKRNDTVTYANAGDIILSMEEWVAFEQLLASSALYRTLDAKFEIVLEKLQSASI